MSADFYYWLRFFDAALMLIGVALNYGNQKMMLLTVTVGAGVLFPILEVSDPVWFYAQCFAVDLFVVIMALTIRARFASVIVGHVGGILCGIHLTGILVGPISGVSFYNVSIPLFEILQLLTCIATSTVILRVIGTVK